jgi:hypothetical protein
MYSRQHTSVSLSSVTNMISGLVGAGLLLLVCMHACMYVCVFMYVCVCARVYVCSHDLYDLYVHMICMICMHDLLCVYVHRISMYVCVYVCMYVCVYGIIAYTYKQILRNACIYNSIMRTNGMFAHQTDITAYLQLYAPCK